MTRCNEVHDGKLGQGPQKEKGIKGIFVVILCTCIELIEALLVCVYSCGINMPVALNDMHECRGKRPN